MLWINLSIELTYSVFEPGTADSFVKEGQASSNGRFHIVIPFRWWTSNAPCVLAGVINFWREKIINQLLIGISST